MRTAVALLSVLLAGCALPGSPASSAGRSGPKVLGELPLDAPPKLVSCVVGPNESRAHDSFLIVPVRFQITSEGVVAAGSAQAFGKIGVWTRPGAGTEAEKRLLAEQEAARDWAQRNAETCTFEPATLGGTAVGVQVEQEFRYGGA